MSAGDGLSGPAAQKPLISVVLPVHGVEEYLPACLDSVLGSPDGAGIEVIAVDDDSPDRCGQILDARAAADSRLRVVHRERAAGPGAARNIALTRARGEYVWFVDPDDMLAEGALAAVAAAVADGRPDLLLLDYLIWRPDGRTEPSPGSWLLRPPGGAVGGRAAALTLAEAPALIERTMTVWSKVFRREFLVGLQTPFPARIHEDVPVSCAALLAARRVALLDRVCYLYRQRERSFLATASMDHFAIFGSYDSVFDRLDAPGAPETPPAVRAALFGRAVEHCSTVLASGLVPARARREFFHQMASDYRRRRPPGYEPPAGPRGLKMRLVERDAYLAYEALAPLNEARVAVRRALRR